MMDACLFVLAFFSNTRVRVYFEVVSPLVVIFRLPEREKEETYRFGIQGIEDDSSLSSRVLDSCKGEGSKGEGTRTPKF